MSVAAKKKREKLTPTAEAIQHLIEQLREAALYPARS